MEVHVKAQFLASYTAKILSNEKVFNPKVDSEIIGRIKNCARESLIRSFAKGVDDIEILRSRLRDDIADYAKKRTKHRPMIVTTLFEIQL